MRQPLATREYATTHQMFEITFPALVQAFMKIEKSVPPPQLEETKTGTRHRFVEKLPQQAIVAKLARSVSGIRSVWLLLNGGMTQEAAALQRTLDEIGADVMFLTGPLTIGEKTPDHDRFLDEFFQEEFEDGLTPLDSPQKRNRVPRKKIRAYNARTFTAGNDSHTASTVVATIDDLYSGFIHAAGVHVLDMYGGDPPRFQIEGLSGTSRADEAIADFRNYLHRGLVDMAFGAKAVGLDVLFDSLRSASNEIAARFDMHGQ